MAISDTFGSAERSLDCAGDADDRGAGARNSREEAVPARPARTAPTLTTELPRKSGSVRSSNPADRPIGYGEGYDGGCDQGGYCRVAGS